MKDRNSIIDEIHKLRERIGRAHDFDADRIALTIRQHEQDAGRPAVAVTPRRTGMSRRLLKFGGGSVDDYATFSTSFTSPSC